MDIMRIGKLIDILEFEEYLAESESLPVVVHKYGEAFSIPDFTCWMEYKNEGSVEGSISFTRNTLKNPILATMVQKVIQLLTPIFPADNPPIPERVHFIRTIGNIVPHRDEAGRNACINIGVKNSSTAITKISNDGIYENFEDNNTSYIIEEGVGYLLNTNQFHSVVGLPNKFRYLITYGFGTKFDILKKVIRYPHE